MGEKAQSPESLAPTNAVDSQGQGVRSGELVLMQNGEVPGTAGRCWDLKSFSLGDWICSFIFDAVHAYLPTNVNHTCPLESTVLVACGIPEAPDEDHALVFGSGIIICR